MQKLTASILPCVGRMVCHNRFSGAYTAIIKACKRDCVVIHAAAVTAEKATLEGAQKTHGEHCEHQDRKLAKRIKKVRRAVFTHAVSTL